jgi:hypothetical protein
VETGVAVACVAIAASSCKVKDPPAVTAPWTDAFERADIGGDYLPTSDGAYRIVDGVLGAKGALNHPLWLRKRLPRDVAIEVDVRAQSPDGDLKVELFGDGESHDKDQGAYTATGYVVCMGGWKNTQSFIARMDEHGNEKVTRKQPRVEVGKTYHWKIVRQGNRVDWFVDDMTTPFLTYEDAAPLTGAGHDYFGFNNWQSDAWFDNLTITPL